MEIRIKATDTRFSGGPNATGNVAYIHGNAASGYRCTLANGTPAAFSYAGISDDEMACKFALADAGTDPFAALKAVQDRGSRFYTYELMTPNPARADKIAAEAPAMVEVLREASYYLTGRFTDPGRISERAAFERKIAAILARIDGEAAQ